MTTEIDRQPNNPDKNKNISNLNISTKKIFQFSSKQIFRRTLTDTKILNQKYKFM